MLHEFALSLEIWIWTLYNGSSFITLYMSDSDAPIYQVFFVWMTLTLGNYSLYHKHVNVSNKLIWNWKRPLEPLQTGEHIWWNPAGNMVNRELNEKHCSKQSNFTLPMKTTSGITLHMCVIPSCARYTEKRSKYMYARYLAYITIKHISVLILAHL